MRDIKFRAWSNNLGMSKPFTLKDAVDSDINEFDIFMQYTGLKDKHGKEIYEGDILRVTDDADEVNVLNSDTGIGVVEWLDKWGFWNISNIENGLGDILNCGYVEIIGNIHENPELLEVSE